jgi:hypothetical protein
MLALTVACCLIAKGETTEFDSRQSAARAGWVYAKINPKKG